MKFTSALIVGLFAPLAFAQSLCGQYDYYYNAGYEFNNNRWGQDSGQGSQCTYVDWSNSNGVGWHADWTWSGGQGNVKSYPYSGRQVSPKRLVSQITNLQTTAAWRYTGNNIRANVAYDLFTASDPNHVTHSGDYELMIWLGRYGTVWPIGSSVGTVNVAGYSWTLYVGWNGSMKVFSFVAGNPITNFNADAKSFFNYLQSAQGFPAGSQYLPTYQFGTEIFTGGPATFTVTNWNAHVR